MKIRCSLLPVAAGLMVIGSAYAAGLDPVRVEGDLRNKEPWTISSKGGDSTFFSGAKFFKVDIPQGAKNPQVTTAGGTGDVDLIMFMNISGNPKPMITQLAHICGSQQMGNIEQCKPNSVRQAQQYYVMVFSRLGGTAYSDVHLRASWD